MGIRRGTWKEESKRPIVLKTNQIARPAKVLKNGMSNSEAHLNSRQDPVNISISNEVSEHRQAELLRATSTAGVENNTPSPVIVYSNSYKKTKEMVKNAGINVYDANIGGSGGVVRQAPEVYSPLFQMANLQLPRERITMNAWNRNFYDTHPLVHNCINLHSTYPISKINIKCKDRKIEQFYNDMCDEIDLINVLQSMSLELWKLGEVIPYLELDKTKGTWSNILIQNPDYIMIKTSVLGGEPIISLKPDAALQRLIQSSNPADIQLRNQIDENIIYHVRKGNNIPLDNFHVSHLAMKSQPYDTRGTSIIVGVYKDLMLYDILRESKFAQAQNLVNPITLVKVGGNGEYLPTSDDLEHWRQTFESAQYDRDFKIISHANIAIERVGAAGQIIDIASDITLILDNILNGLMVPKAIMIQEGSAFSSASVGLEVLKQRYEAFRNMMAKWLIKKVFAPISEIQEFYEYRDGDKKLIVPEVEWNKMVLFDMNDYVGSIKDLASNGVVSKRTLFRSLGLNVEEERRQVKEELINQAILAKEQQILQTMSLGALRSLKPDEDIIEQTELPLPGTPGSQEATPEESGSPPDIDLGDIDLGKEDSMPNVELPAPEAPPIPEIK